MTAWAPTRQSREARTSAILIAARQVFGARGYEKATVAEIAALSGVILRESRGLDEQLSQEVYLLNKRCMVS